MPGERNIGLGIFEDDILQRHAAAREGFASQLYFGVVPQPLGGGANRKNGAQRSAQLLETDADVLAFLFVRPGFSGWCGSRANLDHQDLTNRHWRAQPSEELFA